MTKEQGGGVTERSDQPLIRLDGVNKWLGPLTCCMMSTWRLTGARSSW